MAKKNIPKKTVFVAPTNIVKVVGSKRGSFGLSADEREVIMFVRDHGGIVPETRVKNEVKVNTDVSQCIEKLVQYDYAKKEKNKIILTNNGEYVAQTFRMETISYK